MCVAHGRGGVDVKDGDREMGEVLRQTTDEGSSRVGKYLTLQFRDFRHLPASGNRRH